MPNVEHINPVALAFHHYFSQLHEQYPGIFSQFGLNESDPNNPNTYLIHGRLFFDKFAIDGEPFDFKYDPLSPQQINAILAPLHTTIINTNLPLKHPKVTTILLTQFRALRKTIFNAVTEYIPDLTEALAHLKEAASQLDQPSHQGELKKTKDMLITELNYFSRLIYESLSLTQTALSETRSSSSLENTEDEQTPQKEQTQPSQWAIKRAIRESALLYIEATSSKLSLSPHEYISQAFEEHDSSMKELIEFFSNVTPKYTKETIEMLLACRKNSNQTMITTDGINLLNGFFVYGPEGHKTPKDVQAIARARIAGAVLFKVISEAETKTAAPLDFALKKFVTKVTNSPLDDADAIFEWLLQEHETSLIGQLSLNSLYDRLERPFDEKNKTAIDETINAIPMKLKGIIDYAAFASFHAHSFMILFKQLLQDSQQLSTHPEIQANYHAKVLNFMVNHFDQFKHHPSAIPDAIALLEAMHFPKKHLHIHSNHKQHQDCLARCRALPVARQEHVEKFEVLLRHASKEAEDEEIIKRQAKFDASKLRSRSVFLEDAALVRSLPDEVNRRELFRRGLSSFKMTLQRRSVSHDVGNALSSGEPVKAFTPSTSPKTTPKYSKKKPRSPEVPRKQDATQAESPGVSPLPERHRKIRKHIEETADIASTRTSEQPLTLFAQPTHPVEPNEPIKRATPKISRRYH